MAKKSAVRTVLTLDCECGKYSYHTEKNKRNTEGRLELKKFCPPCRERKTFKGKEIILSTQPPKLSGKGFSQ